MLSISKPKDKFGIKLQGDFFDFDRLYFAIFKLTGQFGINSKCPFDGYGEVCEYILALCYEIRHAYQGDRGLVGVYNGIHKEWFESDENDKDYLDLNDEDEDLGEGDELKTPYESTSPKFDQNILKDISFQNAYFSMDLSIPEAMFYAFVLEDVIQQIDVLKTYLQQKDAPYADDLADEYALSGYQEDVAIVSLFIGKMWRTLYHVLGKMDFHKIYAFYLNEKRLTDNLIFRNCDLNRIMCLIEDYIKQSQEMDNLDLLLNTLLLIIKPV